MKYEVKFPNHSIEKKFEQALSKIPNINIRDEIMDAVENLAVEPRPFGKKPFKKLKIPVQFYQFIAQHRIRIRDHRVLYDVDDNRQIVWILALRKREENTYR